MAGAPGGRAPGPEAGEPLLQRRDSGQGFPEQQRFLSSLFPRNQSCPLMLLKTLETSRSRDLEAGVRVVSETRWRGRAEPHPALGWSSAADPYVKLLLDAMKHSGCAINKERHFSCEDCDGNVSGGFDSSTSQNNIHSQAHMSRVVTHELIHAFDHCRAHVHWFTNVRHLACSEIRAANLSGDCSLINEIFRLRFGFKKHHQTCVRDRAVLSILAIRNISRESAQQAVDEVFESCFNDHEPFGRIPHDKIYARYARRDFQNHDRYYSNI